MAYELEARLQNWGRWARDHRRRGRTCLSSEGGYRSPQRGHWEEPVRGWIGRVDESDARLVELAWTRLPTLWQTVLDGRYVERERPGAIARHAKIKLRDLERVIDDALARISYLLEQLDRQVA